MISSSPPGSDVIIFKPHEFFQGDNGKYRTKATADAADILKNLERTLKQLERYFVPECLELIKLAALMEEVKKLKVYQIKFPTLVS